MTNIFVGKWGGKKQHNKKAAVNETSAKNR